MKRRWNLLIWLGFLVVLAAPVCYLAFFVWNPVTRDAPWATLVIFALGLGLLAWGLRRAWREPGVYRGRIAGSILMSLGVAFAGLFVANFYYFARLLPASAGAPHAGQQAPEFTLPDENDKPVTLASLLAPDVAGGSAHNGVLLIFYRGYW